MIVGITGGIGSGKSLVVRLLQTLGIPSYDADQRAKALMQMEPLKSALVELLGAEAFDSEGRLNRGWVAERIFSNTVLRNQVNHLVHPAVHQDAKDWSERQNSRYTVREAAILLESGGWKMVDKVVVVEAPADVRLERTMQRDGLTSAEVERRLAAQASDEQRQAIAHYTIVNDGRRALVPQVWTIHRLLLNEALSSS